MDGLQIISLENTCPQWNHNMKTMMVNLVDILLTEEEPEKNEETSKLSPTGDSSGVGHSVNMFSVMYNTDKQIFYQLAANESPPKKPTYRHNIRRKGLVSQ